MLARGNLLFSSSDDSDGDQEPRRKKVFRPRINFSFDSESQFLERFRIGTEEFEFVLSLVGPHLQHRSNKNKALAPNHQLLTALHWLGNGGQYHGVADMHGLSKATVCRAIGRVISAINKHIFHVVVKWPEKCDEIAIQFLKKGGFPLVCGCVDGTLINIDAPHENEASFVDRHGNHSLNCMMVCGPDYAFYFVSARWPGSVHDARVLRNSSLATKFESGWRPFSDAVLLGNQLILHYLIRIIQFLFHLTQFAGDSAYGLKDWLIPTLCRNPDDQVEQRFNVCHKSTRSFIERAYGILKERFPCLNCLRVQPKFAGEIVNACTALHNIASKDDFEYNGGGQDVNETIPAADT
jgi:nuclease HARBI1